MRKIIIIIVLIVFIFSLAKAQNPFNHMYGTPNIITASNGILKIDSNKYLMGIFSSSYTFGNVAMIINENGDSLKAYQDNNLIGWTNGFIRYLSNSYATTGGYFVVGDSLQDVLLQVISDSSTLTLKHYGGHAQDYGRDLAILPDSGFMIVGASKSYGYDDYYAYVIRTDKNGDTLWTKSFGDKNFHEAMSILPISDTLFLISGNWGNIQSGSMDGFVFKINLAGDTSEFHLIGDGKQDFFNCMTKSSDGGYAFAGYRDYDITYREQLALYKLDANFILQWIKYYGSNGMDVAYDIKQTSDHGYIIVGYSEQYQHYKDVYIVRTDSLGDTLWTKAVGGTYNEWANGVLEADDGSFLIVGRTYTYGVGDCDAFFLRLKPNGDLTTNIGLETQNEALEFSIYPNPATEKVNLSINTKTTGEYKLELIDIQGRIIKETSVKLTAGTNMHSIDLRKTEKGIYFVRLQGEGTKVMKKIVVE